MDYQNAPNGTLVSVGHPANGVVARKMGNGDWKYLHSGETIVDFDTLAKALTLLWSENTGTVAEVTLSVPDDVMRIMGNLLYMRGGEMECNHCSLHDYIFGSLSDYSATTEKAYNHYREHHKQTLQDLLGEE